MRKIISEQQIEQNKRTIIALLQGTNRQGIDAVIDYLQQSGFFTIPSSIARHHNWHGGLAQHALGVYEAARMQYPQLDGDSLVIACLLHDLCKARALYYDRHGRVRKNHHLHIHGHGYRSVKLLTHVIKFPITDEERLAIRWHMGWSSLQTVRRARS